MSRPEPLSRERVKCLLVDDLEENLLALAALLQGPDVELLLARSGAEALELLLAHDVALALLDVQMPQMDGFEATAAIRATEAVTGGRQRIVAMTAHALNGDSERCTQAGMDGYLSKPLNPRKLYAAVEGEVTESLATLASASPGSR